MGRPSRSARKGQSFRDAFYNSIVRSSPQALQLASRKSQKVLCNVPGQEARHLDWNMRSNNKEVHGRWGTTGCCWTEIRERLLTGLKPDCCNIGFNDGLAAGQTVAHAHVHVIPRRNGDVTDPRGGIRWVIADNAAYWKK
jgi:hypothetical protein